MENIKLNDKFEIKFDLLDSITGRRSVRDFDEYELSKKEISALIWTGYGFSSKTSRVIPSAGGVYPMVLYVLFNQKIYRYKPEENILEYIKSAGSIIKLSDAVRGQKFIKSSSGTIFICCNYEIMSSFYSENGEKYSNLEAGHIAQNISLTAVALGLGTVMLGIFNPDEVKNFLGISGSIEPVYVIPVGKPQN